jgi:hypothetical protein
METNNKAEVIKAWLSNNRRLENQGSLAKKFGKSRTFVSLSLNKQSVLSLIILNVSHLEEVRLRR